MKKLKKYFQNLFFKKAKTEEAVLSSTLTSSNLQLRLNKWDARFEYFKNLAKYAPLLVWRNCKKTQDRLNRINEAFSAIIECEENKVFIKDADKIKFIILQTIDASISKLELSQARKIQIINSQYECINRNKLESKKLNGLIKKITNRPLIIDRHAPVKLFFLKKFFKHHHKLAFKLGSNSGTFRKFNIIKEAILNIGDSIQNTFDSISNALNSLATIIPAICLIFSGLSEIKKTIKLWIKNKNITRRTEATLTTGFIIGAIITSGMFAAAAPGVVAAFIIIDFIRKKLLPFISLRKKIKNTQHEINELGIRLLQLINETHALKLNQCEANILFNKVADVWIEQEKKPSTDMNLKLFQKILFENNTNLTELTLTQMMGSVGIKIDEFLINFTQTRLQDLQLLIEEYKKEQHDKIPYLINGIFNIVGAILLCIPFPPTMIAGAGMILLSTMIDTAMHHHLFTKIKNFLKKHFNLEVQELEEKCAAITKHVQDASLTNNMQANLQLASGGTTLHLLKKQCQLSTKLVNLPQEISLHSLYEDRNQSRFRSCVTNSTIPMYENLSYFRDPYLGQKIQPEKNEVQTPTFSYTKFNTV